MKVFMKLMVVLVVFASLAGCTPQSPTTAVLTSVSGTPGYPVPASGSAYPASGSAPATIVPAYMLPGFITATPDPSLADVIISEVRHEGNLEVLVIKNISASEQNIGAFMLFSPELSDRKILPADLKLASGATFEIYNGDTTGQTAGQTWLKQPLLQKALDEVWLVTATGRVAYYFVYYPAVNP